jgi:hypothetical protein
MALLFRWSWRIFNVQVGSTMLLEMWRPKAVIPVGTLLPMARQSCWKLKLESFIHLTNVYYVPTRFQVLFQTTGTQTA